MPIPKFTIDGILPPYVGPSPAASPATMTPYAATATEIAATFGMSAERIGLLNSWLKHREELRKAGVVRGFQWLDGSFVEDKTPRDIDVVSFLYRPAGIGTAQEFDAFAAANPQLFDRGAVKAGFHLDAFFVDIQGNPESTVLMTRYLGALFSHRRGDELWKGMVQVRLENANDDLAAASMLNSMSQGAGP